MFFLHYSETPQANNLTSFVWSQVLDKIGPYALWGRNVFCGNRNPNWGRQKALWGMNVALVMALLSFGRGALIDSTFGRGAVDYTYFWSGQFDWLWRFTFGCGGLIDSAFGCGDSRLVVAI